VPPSIERERALVEPGQVLAAETDLAAIRAVEPAEQVEERRLAAAGGTEKRDQLAGEELEVDAAQRVDRVGTGPVGAREAADRMQRLPQVSR
jgi:SpoU rRNA methylase family enzyme